MRGISVKPKPFATPVRTVNPNASETPTNPIPGSGNPAAKTALPQPPNTNLKVQINSTVNFFIS